MQPPTAGAHVGVGPNRVLGCDGASELRRDQSDRPNTSQKEEPGDGEDGGKTSSWGKASWKGPRLRTRTRCHGERSPAIPEGIVDKPESQDGRFGCSFCKRSLGCRTVSDLRGHVLSKKHRKAMARHQEFNNTDTVACVEDTTRSVHENGEDTTPETQGNGEDTTRSARGNGEDTTPAMYGNGEDTTWSAHGNGEDTTPETHGNGEDTTWAMQGNNVTDGPKKYETEELRNGEDGGKKKSVGKCSRKGVKKRKRSAPALPEGFIEKPDGRFRCTLCRRDLGYKTNTELIDHVHGKTHRKALASRHEVNIGMVDGVEDIQATHGNGEDTARATQGNDLTDVPKKFEIEELPEGFIQKPDGQFQCIVCNKNLGCSSISAAIVHIQRKNHCEALARRQEFITDMVDCVEDTLQGNIEDTTRAMQGNDLTDGPNKYETEDLPEGFIQKPDGLFRCIVCKCKKKYRFGSITTISGAIQHVQGKKHRAALARGRQQYNTYMLECTEDATQATRGNDVAVPPGFTLEDDTQFRCIVCDVVCNSKASVGSHVRDKKHREQKLLMALRDRK